MVSIIREIMTNEKLKRELITIRLEDCEEIIDDYIYYIKKKVRERMYNASDNYSYNIKEREFIVIANQGVKQGIILRHGEKDLHWYVLEQWRDKHILSNALRTGVLNMIWPENKTVTCCYDYGENPEEKYAQTKHLADIAGLEITDEDTAIIEWV